MSRVYSLCSLARITYLERERSHGFIDSAFTIAL